MNKENPSNSNSSKKPIIKKTWATQIREKKLEKGVTHQRPFHSKIKKPDKWVIPKKGKECIFTYTHMHTYTSRMNLEIAKDQSKIKRVTPKSRNLKKGLYQKEKKWVLTYTYIHIYIHIYIKNEARNTKSSIKNQKEHSQNGF